MVDSNSYRWYSLKNYFQIIDGAEVVLCKVSGVDSSDSKYSSYVERRNFGSVGGFMMELRHISSISLTNGKCPK